VMTPPKTVPHSASVADLNASRANEAQIPLFASGKHAADRQADAPEAEGIPSSDEIAVSEMLAPSHPAPPMPLTEQEKLLMRLVRRSDPVELAMLDSKLGALKDAEEKAEFQRFFVPPPTIQATASDPDAEQTTPAQTQSEQTPPVQSQPEQPKIEPSPTGDSK
jgi:hypothetical protein